MDHKIENIIKMKQEKQIDLKGYLRSKTQENYYQKMRENLTANPDDTSFTNFLIDLYNMGKI
jgi:hypothetical protein